MVHRITLFPPRIGLWEVPTIRHELPLPIVTAIGSIGTVTGVGHGAVAEAGDEKDGLGQIEFYLVMFSVMLCSVIISIIRVSPIVVVMSHPVPDTYVWMYGTLQRFSTRACNMQKE